MPLRWREFWIVLYIVNFICRRGGGVGEIRGLGRGVADPRMLQYEPKKAETYNAFLQKNG
jgi:hypothetical protein